MACFSTPEISSRHRETETTQVVYHIDHIDIRYKQKTTLFKPSWQTLPHIMELLYTERSQTILRQPLPPGMTASTTVLTDTSSKMWQSSRLMAPSARTCRPDCAPDDRIASNFSTTNGYRPYRTRL